MPDISTYFTPANHILISGIGGVSTSALASLLRLRGIAVSGVI